MFFVPPDEEFDRPPAGEGEDPERAAREAARRAATTLRRYATSNSCDRLWSLTYSDEFVPPSLGDVWDRHAATFRERIYALVGERFPMVLVPERGSINERPHLHMLTNRYLSKRLVEQAWGMGWVDGRRITAWRDVDSGEVVNLKPLGRRARCRAAASYLSGYVKKGFIEHHEFARHRYSTTRGFACATRSEMFARKNAAWAWCSLSMQGVLVESWSSDDLEQWNGPPVWLGYWDDP